jgi:pimeloyl-ACP methyl ester carboxylesterase
MSITIRSSQIPVRDGEFHLLQAGPANGSPVLFLHGWPEDASAWSSIMRLAAAKYRCLAVDLPGIGGSRISPLRGETDYLAGLLREFVDTLGLKDLTLVGHDIGGMVTFAYLRRFDDLRAAVIMNTVIPGIAPWEQVLVNPYIWHFAFHSVPGLPEMLVRHEVRAYFDYFYNAIAANPNAITPSARQHYARSYADPAALSQGFEFYRAFRQDAKDNALHGPTISTPLLYLRGSAEGGDIADYAAGLASAGIQAVHTVLLEGAGHFAPEEAPENVWAVVEAHIAASTGRTE